MKRKLNKGQRKQRQAEKSNSNSAESKVVGKTVDEPS